jgi:ligand-binding sensor domain-containing protein
MHPPRPAQLCLFAILVVAVLITSCGQNRIAASTVPPTGTVTAVARSTSTLPASSTPPAATPSATGLVWERMEKWAPANQVRAMLIDHAGDLWTGGPAGLVHWNLKTNTPTVYAISQDPENTNVVALSQTPDGSIWAGTDGNGLARFDGTTWRSFTVENGLPGNYVNDQTVTPDGKLWVVAQEKAYDSEPNQKTHLGHFDGHDWLEDIQVPDLTWITAAQDGSLATGLASNNYRYPNSNLWIIDHADEHNWYSLVFDVPGNQPLQGQAISAITVALDETIWVTTWHAVFHYKNGRLVKIASPLEKEIHPQVSSIAVSANGTAWFGFSIGASDVGRCGEHWDYPDFPEQGVYRYEGKTWTHFTAKDGLVDNKICAIGLDTNGNVWFGSFDRGVSWFDGQEWKSYVIP